MVFSCTEHLLKHFHVEAIVRLRRAVLRNLLCKLLKERDKEVFFFFFFFHPPKHLFVRIASLVFGSQRAFINQHVLRGSNAQPRFGSDCGNTRGHKPHIISVCSWSLSRFLYEHVDIVMSE